MSIFEEESLLSRLNDNRTDSVDAHIAYCLRLADSVGALSGGVYDVTVKPLVEAWGFCRTCGRCGARRRFGSSASWGRGKVRIEGGRLVKADPRVQLDFNSVAKGLHGRSAGGAGRARGARNYLVEIGGEIRCRGVNASGRSVAHRGRDAVRRERPLRRLGAAAPPHERGRAGHVGQLPPLLRRRRRREGGPHDRPPHGAQRALAPAVGSRWRRPRAPRPTRWARCHLAMGADAALERVRADAEARVYFILAAPDGATREYVSPAMEALLLD